MRVYKNLIYSDSRRFVKEFELVVNLVLPNRVSEVSAHINHVHLQQILLHIPQQSYSHSEYSSPSVHEEHVKDGRKNFVRQETGKQSHYPLGSEIICRHLNLP